MLERLMHNTPLFRERPRAAQVVTGLVLPILAGAIAGALLGLNAAAYWAISLVALAGGILGGFEHADGWDGADRGLVGGALFGISLLIFHAIIGGDAQVSLPNFAPILAVFTAIIGMLAGALGGRLRRGAIERNGGAARRSATAAVPPGS
jgi:hypothetical protein